MIDCVQTYHDNPYTCGVAKWNVRLARELGVPLRRIGQPAIRPLISVQPSEVPEWACPQFRGPYDLILHGWPTPKSERERMRNRRWVLGADRVWTLAAETLEAVRAVCPDAATLPCPSTVEEPRPREAVTILTFGMAHKATRVLRYYERLRDVLGDSSYTVLVSVGVHDGSPWDEALEMSATALRQIFRPDRVEVLGFLGDAALDREIRAATACAAFYVPAWRTNNTTAWAVLERGQRLITNRDADSPAVEVIDIATCSLTTILAAPAVVRAPRWADVALAIGAVVPCAS